jgi:uncharacterized membrane protein
MISAKLGNRLVFIFSLLGLAVAAFLFYEYTFSSSVYCLVGTGCDTVRNSPYANFLGIEIPVWGTAFYLGMVALSIIRSNFLQNSFFFRLQVLGAASGVVFGTYLTYLELFVIHAICFWCVLSYIISTLILLSVILGRKINENRD